MPRRPRLGAMPHAQLQSKLTPTSTHWGNCVVETSGSDVVAIHPSAEDGDPSPVIRSLLDSADPGVRIPQPMVRKSYLAHRWQSDGALRGREPFVATDWPTALNLAAETLRHVKEAYGNEAIYGGSYGWASAGRLHHAQSQIHRFLNLFGGYTASVNTYSSGAAEVIVPHVLGLSFQQAMLESPTIEEAARNGRCIVAFGGISMKNMQVNAGGVGNHTAREKLKAAKQMGLQVINISPIRNDVADFLEAEWWPCRPNSDVAFMLGLVHTLLVESLHDRAFLGKYCVGFEEFARYVLGSSDGQPKDADWASQLSEIPAEKIRQLARKMAAAPCLIGISWSLQRAEHGEQPYWMATVLAAMLGYIGIPGAGVGYGYGCTHNVGFRNRRPRSFAAAALPQGRNPVHALIPVARIADMLLKPGARFDYNGKTYTYPHVRLVYWAGGNPFHHHQDLNRLREAWSQPAAIIVHDSVWTAAARNADIVFPACTMLERNDFAAGAIDPYISPMRRAVEPYRDSRSDYAILCGLAECLGFGPEFSEGKDEMGWVQELYEATRRNAADAGVGLPAFEAFWQGAPVNVEDQATPIAFALERFRADPLRYPLPTPSGRIEIFSSTIAGFGYDDCPGHPAWLAKQEWLGSPRAVQFPLHLISNQPRTRLHGQYDHGVTSRRSKIHGREPARMNPLDANRRGIEPGSVVRIFNDRGSCLAGVCLSEDVRPGVVEIGTGATYDPLDPTAKDSLDVHGNPNVLTRDVGTSRLAQATTAHSCLVEVERFDAPLPAIRAFRPPPIESGDLLSASSV